MGGDDVRLQPAAVLNRQRRCGEIQPARPGGHGEFHDPGAGAEQQLHDEQADERQR